MTPAPTVDARPDAPSPSGAGRRWRVAVLGTIVTGSVVALLAGALWRQSVHHSERQAFADASTDVLGTAELLLSQDVGFVKSLRVGVTHEPSVSPSGFLAWFHELDGSKLDPGGLGTVVVRRVATRELAAFQARRDADPTFRRLVQGLILPAHPSARGYSCLLSAAVVPSSYDPQTARLLQGDWCDPRSAIGRHRGAGTTQAQLMRLAADTRAFVVHSVRTAHRDDFFIETAYYRAGAPLGTLAQRRRALLGWVSSSFSVPALLRESLAPHRGLSLTFYHRDPRGALERIGVGGHAARSPRFSASIAVPLAGGWLVRVAGAQRGPALSADVQGLMVAGATLLMTLLLAALLHTLVRSRAQALGLVDQKTGELRHQALHDALTGLPNRVLALDRAEHMLARARREQTPVAALYVDLDGFKQVNDTFGHAAGDELLQVVAQRLRSVVRAGDTAARLGGDEFVVLVEGANLAAGPELVAERVLEVLRQPYDLGERVGRELALTASVGVAWGLRESADELLRDADLALYEAKADGRNRYVAFKSAMQTAARDRVELEMDLAGALERDELFLLYQPTFELSSESITGVEALVRWQHPQRGLIGPDRFIPLAEESDLIVSIGAWVLRESCRQAARWHAQGRPLRMSVNVSARQLDAGGLIDDVRAALRDSGLPAAYLTLEVTETALMRDPDATATRLRQLKRLGVRIAIDDFGTGYSSLAYLRQFPADALKIDRSFVAGIADSKHASAIVHTLVRLGKTLNIETLAEGIEERYQLETLQREHCDLGQGFLFSRPVPAQTLDELFTAEGDRQRSGEHALDGAAAAR